MKRIILVLIVLLCVACKLEEEQQPISNDEPTITTKIPLPNNSADIIIGRVEEDINKATSFDDTIDEALITYFEMLGISKEKANVDMHHSKSTVRLNYGINPRVQATLVSQTIFNASATYDIEYDECKISIEFVPNEKDIIINVVDLNGNQERIEYNLNNEILDSKYSQYIDDALNELQIQQKNNPIVLNETFEYVKYLMSNAYHIQADDYVLDDEKIKEIQKVIARSGIYSLPLSFTRTQYSMFIKDDLNILIMIDGYNNINVDFYKYETMLLTHEDEELPTTLIYANGYISYVVSGYEMQRYEYMNGEINLVANDGDEVIFLGIEDELLEISKDYEEKYSSISLKLIELSDEIKELITRKS